MDISAWLAFFAASWAISISPGAGAVAAMTAGLQHGFARGYFLTFGLVLGLWSLLLLVGVGLGALIMASSTAFAVIKWLGVGYLLWLGIAQWRAPAVGLQARADDAARVSRRRVLMRGWMINTLNPKPTLFMLAVVPQFLNPAQPLVPQYLVIARHAGLHRPRRQRRLHRVRVACARGLAHAAADALGQSRFRRPVHRAGDDAGDGQAQLTFAQLAAQRLRLRSLRLAFEPPLLRAVGRLGRLAHARRLAPLNPPVPANAASRRRGSCPGCGVPAP